MVYNTPEHYNPRQLRGQLLAEMEGTVNRIGEGNYQVKSQSGKGIYLVILGEKPNCSCPDFAYRNEKCKHIFAVEFSFKLRQKVIQEKVIEPIQVSECIFCHSIDIKKFGVRKNKNTNIQRYLCGSCSRTFSFNIGFERMKHNPQAITTAMQLYFSGESLRNTMRSLKLLGVEVSHQTVFKWIRKYVTLMEKYVDKLKPSVGDTWRADEVFVKFSKNMKYVFALMDNDTRYWLAQEVADTKFSHDARNLFRQGKEVAGKGPKLLITDGLPAYKDAFNKEYFTIKEPRPKHICAIRLAGDKNNNRMERLNGEFRDREKVMRGLKKKETPIISGYQIYHNYIRGHLALRGKTPAEVAGIKVQGDNKWVTIIQNAKAESLKKLM
jgi:transposase-like protein